jgi:hypothetical protein
MSRSAKIASSRKVATVAQPLRNKSVTAKVTDEEYSLLESLAESRGIPLGRLSRELLLNALQSDPRSAHLLIAPVDKLLLTEFIGLRMLVLNLLAPISRGESLTAAAIQDLIRRVDKEKLAAAVECLKKNIYD